MESQGSDKSHQMSNENTQYFEATKQRELKIGQPIVGNVK